MTNRNEDILMTSGADDALTAGGADDALMTGGADGALLKRLFEDASHQKIADDGFSDRVMASLPEPTSSRAYMLSKLWTWFCIVLGLVLFFALDGLSMLRAALQGLLMAALTELQVLVVTAPTLELHLDLLVPLALALVFAAVYLPYQTARRWSAAL